MKTIRTSLTVLAASVAIISPLVVANDAYVDYRQHVMAAVGGHAAAIGSIVKSRLPELEAVALHASAVADTAATVPSAFAAELHEGATDAKPEIWQNVDDFRALNEQMREASLALAEVARGGDADAVRHSMRAFTKSCGACHRKYRKPKEESYKQLN